MAAASSLYNVFCPESSVKVFFEQFLAFFHKTLTVKTQNEHIMRLIYALQPTGSKGIRIRTRSGHKKYG